MGRAGEAVTGRLEEAVRLVRDRSTIEPRAVLVAGSAVAARLTTELTERSEAELAELCRGEDASGARLLLGRLRGVPVVALTAAADSRPRPAPADSTLAIRMGRLLAGAASPPPPLVIGDQCLSVGDPWSAGEVALVEDHLNLMGRNPLVGTNADELGPRFPDMTRPYDQELQALALAAALARRVPLRRAVYAGLAGPQRPTRAERRMLRWMGAEVAGTGVVPDVIVARHLAMPVLALLSVVDAAPPDPTRPEIPTHSPPGGADDELAGLIAAVVERIGGGSASI